MGYSHIFRKYNCFHLEISGVIGNLYVNPMLIKEVNNRWIILMFVPDKKEITRGAVRS